MATLYTQQSKNVTKTWILMIGFFVLISAVGFFVGEYYNNPGVLYIAFIFSVIMNIVGYWYSDKIALKLAGAKQIDLNKSADPARDKELLRVVENLSITAGLPMPKVCIIEDKAPNAFATGRDKNHAAVAVTTGLLGIMTRDELEGVVAHELAHIGNRDTLLSTVVVILVGLLSIISDIMLRSSLGGRHRDNDNNNAGGVLAIIGIILIVLSPIIGTIIQLAISRKREYLADASGALLTRYPEGLANALRKIESYSAHGGSPLRHASNATAHLYISNPFGAGSYGARVASGFSRLFMTHPATADRIKALLGDEMAKRVSGGK